MELCGQGTHRRAAAEAGLSRVEAEIAAQEVLLAARACRTFYAVLYRQEKLRLLDERVRLNQEARKVVERLRDGGKLTAGDVVLMDSEVAAIQAQVGPARVALAAARADLRQALGSLQDCRVEGALGGPLPPLDPPTLTQAALEQRPDLHARRAAVAEAKARVRLEVANRYGAPAIGPFYELDPTQTTILGGRVTVPLPLCNTRRGEILQREAEEARAESELHQAEVQVQQDVLAGTARLREALSWINTLQSQLLPAVKANQEAIDKLFAAERPGADVLRVVQVRRSVLQAYDTFVDAQWEVRQAQADLMAAVGAPGLVLGRPLFEDAPKKP
jgi:cobalt-zinc-cadmium efflux system outer membrane protein